MSDADTAPVGRRRSRTRVAVVGDRFLFADAVRMALAARRFTVMSTSNPIGVEQLRAATQRLHAFRPAVGLLLTEADLPGRLHQAEELIAALPITWLVLTDSPEDATRGAFLRAGAAGILSMSVGMDDLARAILLTRSGRALLPAAERTRLVEAWRTQRVEEHLLDGRVANLTRREQDVLDLLYQGLGVAVIADRFGVSEETVRSQVKSVLRKLEVNSQLAAVAAYRHVVERRHGRV